MDRSEGNCPVMSRLGLQDSRGLTLVEIILAIALVGIIALGLITAFSSQLVMMVGARGITNRTFAQQAATEDELFDLRQHIQLAGPSDAIVYKGEPTAATVRLTDGSQEWDVEVQKLVVPSVDIRTSGISVYVSRSLARAQREDRLTVQNVRIDVSTAPGSSVANIGGVPDPSLIAQYDDIAQPERFLEYLFYWWRSYPGAANPQWPEDYERVASILPNVRTLSPSTLVNTVGVNRFVMLVIAPVDIHGVRGDEMASSFAVFLQGPDWRLGQTAWIDKNLNVLREASDVDVPLNVLTSTFDTAVGYYADENFYNTSGGDLYVPMWIGGRPNPQPASPAPIAIAGTSVIDWTVDRSIHLTKGIDATNSSNISLKTRQGNIVLHQFSELDNNIYGPFLKTAGDILFSTLGRGSIYLNSYSVLEGRNLNLLAKGNIVMDDSQLQATRNIILDATQDSTIAGNRDLVVRNSTLRLLPAWVSDRTIDLRTRTAIRLADSSVVGNTHAPSSINLLAQSTSYWVDLDNVSFDNINVRLSTSSGSPGIQMQGGAWSEGYTMTIGDARTIIFSKNPNPVGNQGMLNLGNTGRVRFATSMAEDLQRPLSLSLSEAASGQAAVSIATTNYYRNLSYAGSSEPKLFSEPGAWYDLGSSEGNMAVAVSQTTGDGIASLSFAYDGNGRITLSGEADGAADVVVTLTVRDKFSEMVGTPSGSLEATISFRVFAEEAGPATITIVGP